MNRGHPQPTQAEHGPGEVRRAGALDPRLFSYASGVRRYLGACVLVGSATAALIVVQAWLIAMVVARATVASQSLTQLRPQLLVLLLVTFLRAALAWLAERTAERASASVKSDLRMALVEQIKRIGPAGVDRERPGSLVVLATSGVDALDDYFARYLPQLFLAAIIPVSMVVVLSRADWISAALIAVTVPLIPLFMALVGASTEERMEHQARLLERLAGHFLDVLAGLPTLKVFGRATAQVAAIRELTDRYRRSTMATLKVAFLSSLVLELLATYAVALLAVAVGLRLLSGDLNLSTALFVLILAPEAYLPLRRLGASYHGSAEGMRAAAEIFDVLALPCSTRGIRNEIPDPAASRLRVNGLEVRYRGRPIPALQDVAFEVAPGEIVAITGPSGCGKSTLLSVLLGLGPPWLGSVQVGGSDLTELDPDRWRDRLAWVPQRPYLFARSIADNVRLGRPDATDKQVRAAISDAGLDEVVARLPQGLATKLGHEGAGLSAGQRQRLALARAFLRDAPLLLLDEPTANLDGATEQRVLDAVRRLMVGRTVVMVAHRPSLVMLADREIPLAQTPALAS